MTTSPLLQQLLRRAAAARALALSTSAPASVSTTAAVGCSYASVRGRGAKQTAIPAFASRQYHHDGTSWALRADRSAAAPEEEQRHQQRAAAATAAAPRRFSSSAAAAEEEEPKNEQEGREEQQEEAEIVVYRGALGPSLRRLKLVSLANTAVALAASPALSWLAEQAPDGSAAAAYARAATVAATAAGFGVLTTLGLHWFTKPYVHEIVRVRRRRNGGGGGGGEESPSSYRLRALSPLGRPVWRPLDVSAVRAADVARPLATFVEGERVYYVDAAGFAEGEDALREALTPMSAAEAAAHAAAAEAQAAAQAAAAAAAEAEEEQQQQQHEEAAGGEGAHEEGQQQQQHQQHDEGRR